jgi:ATP/maltotriose-dependent transcriptional regulator MalT
LGGIAIDDQEDLQNTITDRELGVLCLAALGLTDEDIGKALYVGDTTVKTHLRRSSPKIGANGRETVSRRLFKLGIMAAA